MGNKPMPEGCTSEMMWVMLDVIDKIEHKDFAMEQITWYEGLWRDALPKYNEAKLQRELGDEEKQRYDNLEQAMKLIKEGILFWRGELTE